MMLEKRVALAAGSYGSALCDIVVPTATATAKAAALLWR